MLDERVLNFHSKNSRYHVGLVEDKPYAISKGSLSLLSKEMPRTDSKPRKDITRIYISNLYVYQNLIPKDITWVHISKYFWQDTLKCVATYTSLSKWRSNYLDREFWICNKDLITMYERGINNYLYAGLISLKVLNGAYYLYPCRVLSE